MLHTAGVSIPEISVPSPGRNKPLPRILGGSLLIASSRHSDSGVRREGREREKNKEEKRERGGNAFLRSHPPPPPRWFFFLLLTSLCGVPGSERLEQTTLLIPETKKKTVLWIKCGQLYPSIYLSEGCPIHPHRNGPYKLCVDPYGSNGSTTGVYGL